MAQFISPATTFVVLRGSSTVMALINAIGRQYMADRPNVGLPVIGGGTARGYKSVLDGTADIGMASGDMPENLRSWSKRRYRELSRIILALDGIGAIVHPSNPLNGLDFAQLADIYTGAVRDWSEIGGPKGAIAVYAQDPLQGTQETWNRLVAGDSEVVTPRAVVVPGATIGERVAADPLGIGYESALLVDANKLKVLQIDGSLPVADEVRAGKYQLRRQLTLLTRSPPGGEVAAFLAYCTAPDKGQKLIKQSGAVPARTG